MSGLLAFATARRQSRAALHGTWLDGGTLEIYSGTRPADPDTAVTDQVLLCAFTLPDPAGAAVDGIFDGEPPDRAMIVADGTAAWARAYDDIDAVIWDADVGSSGSGNAVELDNVSLVSGAYVTVTALTITEG